MSDKIRFFTRTFMDYTEWEEYNGLRLDLLHSVFSFDNKPEKYNAIVMPDPSMFMNWH
jgi:hypothetical protein